MKKKVLLPFLLIFVLLIIFFVVTPNNDKAGLNPGATETIYSNINSGNYYDNIYKSLNEAPKSNSNIAIVNHHLFAPQLIAETLSSISSTNEKTVIIISPDHFNAGSKDFTISDATWDTYLGDLKPELLTINKLNRLGFVNINNEPFYKEHGVSNIIPFAKKAFPNSKVVPIIIKEKAGVADIQKLADAISQVENKVVIGSFDFVHNENIAKTKSKDLQSINIISAIDVSRYDSIVVDSQKGALAIMEIARKENYNNFKLYENTSAAELTGRDSSDNTSYITGVFY